MRISCYYAYATTSRKGASVPGSSDGAVRFRARNDVGDNGIQAIERAVRNHADRMTTRCLDDVIMTSLRNASKAIDVNLMSMLFAG